MLASLSTWCPSLLSGGGCSVGGGGVSSAPAPALSGRTVVSSGHVASCTPGVFKPSYSLIVKSLSNESSEVMREKLFKDVKAAKGVRVTSMAPAKEGGLIVRTAVKNDIELLKNSSALRKAGFEVVEPSPLPPRMLVVDVSSEITSEAFMSEMYKRNLKERMSVDEFHKSVKFVRRFDSKNGISGNIILEVSSSIRNFFLNEERLFVSWRS